MEKEHFIRNRDTGKTYRIQNRDNWPYIGFELEMKITQELQTRNWEFIKIEKTIYLPEK